MEAPKINVYALDGTLETSYLVSDLIPNWREEFYYSDAVFQTVVSEESSRRLARPHTKTKGEVSGGGKKPYRQKHTGRARQGSRRNPQFVGGGTAFGPRKNVNHYKKVNKRVRALAIRSCWTEALSAQKVLAFSERELPDFPAQKTKTIASFFSLINFKRERENSKPKNILLLVKERGSKLELGARNLPNLEVLRLSSLSPRDLLVADLILLSPSGFQALKDDYFSSWQ